MVADQAQFAALFNNPTVDSMYALANREFERFVAYVLRRAGYEVKELGPFTRHGVDLEIRMPGSRRVVGGVECKKYKHTRRVTATDVKGARGSVTVNHPGVKPYVITTSDFTEDAHVAAETGTKHAYLLNGTQFERYIHYIQGSLRDDDDTITVISPEFFAGREQHQTNGASDTNILTIANNKGGVGKTTTAFYLGAEIARMGKRVLLIDLDGQANLTEYCFPEQVFDTNDGNGQFPNIAEYFSHQRPLKDLVKETEISNLGIIPSDISLRFRDLGGSGRPGIEFQFARDVEYLAAQPLAALGGKPDWIIIDTPPAMSIFTRAGLAAARYILAPVRPRRLSLQGTKNMLATLRTVNALMTRKATFLGTIITHWDDLKLSQNFMDLLLPPALQEFGTSAFTVKIPTDNRLEYLAPGSSTSGAQAYRALAEELLNHVHQ